MAARRVPDEETHVRVAVRIRPLNSKELVKGSKICLKKVINQVQLLSTMLIAKYKGLRLLKVGLKQI